MAYDEALADRLRALVTGPEVVEKHMFGGLAFLVAGHMAVAASSTGDLMVRVDPADADDLRSEPGTELMVMRGTAVRGWLLVAAAAVTEQQVLERWVTRGTSYAGSLPPKG